MVVLCPGEEAYVVTVMLEQDFRAMPEAELEAGDATGMETAIPMLVAEQQILRRLTLQQNLNAQILIVQMMFMFMVLYQNKVMQLNMTAVILIVIYKRQLNGNVVPMDS